MADPCVENTETVDLDTAGTPAVLSANAHDVSHTASGTQGDDLPHDVDDVDVPHVQTRTIAVANPLASEEVRGIVIASFTPFNIFSTAIPSTFAWSAELIIGGVSQDDTSGSSAVPANPDGDDANFQAVIRALLGEIVIPPGGSVNVTFRKTITNTGFGMEWIFLTGGDKMVAHIGP